MADPARPTLADLEREFGHPGDMWAALKERVQMEALTNFREVAPAWVSLMWTLDQYRIASIVPRDMGEAKLDDAKRLAGIYRSKGNWFANLTAHILQNHTTVPINPRTRVQGMSQVHQIDVAWPAREEDVLVCAETKVTGGPAYANYPQRGALADITNRRKELKFAATDLKLYRRDQNTEIAHWGDWRENAPPKTYFLWAARLRRGAGRTPGEDIARLVSEAQALVNSYLDGAGIIAWQLTADGSGYEIVPIPVNAQVSDLNDLMYRIASVIRRTMRHGEPPAPVRPTSRAVDVASLLPDSDDGNE